MCLTVLHKFVPGEPHKGSVSVYKGFTLSEKGLQGPVYPYVFNSGMNYPKGVVEDNDGPVGEGVFHAYLNLNSVREGDFIVQCVVSIDDITHIGFNGDIGVNKLKLTSFITDYAKEVYENRKPLLMEGTDFFNDCGVTYFNISYLNMTLANRKKLKKVLKTFPTRILSKLAVSGIRVVHHPYITIIHKSCSETVITLLHNLDKNFPAADKNK